ncbi:MAG: hypothetical protein Q7O66_16560 [Dehalococcoidia bacterium]|nr:hypothetical protein [Dehalococcoidia bacterium]
MPEPLSDKELVAIRKRRSILDSADWVLLPRLDAEMVLRELAFDDLPRLLATVGAYRDALPPANRLRELAGWIAAGKNEVAWFDREVAQKHLLAWADRIEALHAVQKKEEPNGQ